MALALSQRLEAARERCRALSAAALLLGLACAADADEVARIIDVLAIEPGAVVADVGAGSGDWATALVEAVGPDGFVYATEVEDDLVSELMDVALPSGNMAAVRGTELTTGLEGSCCDRLLLRLVYHHFTDPAPMRDSLKRSLRPNGLVAIVDIAPQSGWSELEGVPDRGGHGLTPEDLIAEMTADGFEVVRRVDDWDEDEPDRYCVVFRLSP